MRTVCVKRDLFYGKKDRFLWQKRPIHLAQATRSYSKRLRTWANETYISGKRDLHIWQKRPTYLAKETYLLSSCRRCGPAPPTRYLLPVLDGV